MKKENFLTSNKEYNLRLFMLYGNLSDIYITENLDITDFNVYLKNMLIAAEYDRIVFYDGSRVVGKHTYDDKSAALSISRAGSEYRAKYGHNAEEDLFNKNNSEKSVVDNTEKNKKKKRHRTNVFVDDSKVINELKDETKLDEEKTEDETVTDSSIKITHVQREITETNYYQEAMTFLNDPDIKTALIFRNAMDFLNNTKKEILRKYKVFFSSQMEMGDYKKKNENIVILLHNNDISNSADLMNLAQNINCAGFSNLLMDSVTSGSGTPLFNQKRCYYVGMPDIDEISYLLRYLKIVGTSENKHLDYLFSEEKVIAEQILFYSRVDKTEKCTLFNIKLKLSEYINRQSEDSVKITADDVSVIYNNSIDTKKDPLKELNTEGWEKIYERFSSPEFDVLPVLNDDEDVFSFDSFVPDKDILRVTSEKDTDVKDIPHFMLEGNPGVGKSTVARLIGQILHRAGYLKVGHTVEVSGNSIIGQYVGETPAKVTDLLNEAEGGVLFIDEAHNLYVNKNESTNSNANYRKEAITTIVQAMTDKRRHFCLILAGYALSKIDSHDGVRALFDMDPGLESRFKGEDNIILIEDFKPSLLKKIFINNLYKRGYKISTEVEEGLDYWKETKYQTRDRRKFANARTVENWVSSVTASVNKRNDPLKTVTLKDFKDEDYRIITEKRSKTIEEVFKDIDEKYVGFRFMKDLISIQNLNIEEYRMLHGDTTDEPPRPRHMIFRGNPGTGKTTGAKLLMDFFRITKVMGGKDIIMLNAFSLLQSNSAEIIREKIDTAKEKDALLFIDEAHNLHGNHFGEIALRSLLNPMTEEPFTVIFAVYTSRFDDFMSIDPGIESRVEVIDFPDYTSEQLYEIMERMLEKQNREMLNNCKDKLKVLFKNWYDTRNITPNFGNARSVERLIESMDNNRKKRIIENSISNSDRFILTYEDVPKEYQKIIRTQMQSANLDEVLKQFDDYIGFDELKSEIMLINSRIQYNKKFRKDQEYPLMLGHYAFTGNPGTGKTTGGKIFASALYAMGALKTPNFNKISAKDLIAGYVGQTSMKTAEMLKKALNGVLLIDEAYALASDPNDHGSGNSFKEDAVNEILQFMEDNVNNACIIFAGYTNDIDRLKKSNSGLDSRVGTTIEFHDYSVDECVQILQKYCDKEHYKLSDEAVSIFTDIIFKEKESKNFGNARSVRNIYNKAIKKQNLRIVFGADEYEPGSEEIYTLIGSDFFN